MQETMPGARRRGRPPTAWMDNINTWTGLSVVESMRMTEDRDKWRKYVHGVANTRSKKAKEQKITVGIPPAFHTRVVVKNLACFGPPNKNSWLHPRRERGNPPSTLPSTPWFASDSTRFWSSRLRAGRRVK